MTDYQDFTTIDMPPEERKKLNVGDIWANTIYCKLCKTEARSKNRRDFASCKCGKCAVDGGSAGLTVRRIIGDTENYEDRIVLYTHLHPEVKY